MNTKGNISIRDLYSLIADTSITELGISSDEFKQAMASHPACRKKIEIKTAEALKEYKQGRYSEALVCYTELIGLIQESSKYLKIMADAIKNDQEKAAAQPDSTSLVNLLNTFHETNNSFLAWDAEASATMYTMRGNVKRNLGRLDEAINDYKEGLKHESVREAAQKNINALQERLASKKTAADKTEYESTEEQAAKYARVMKQLEEAKKRLVEYKEPDYGPIDTFDDVPDAGKALAARLDEINKRTVQEVSERITERERTLQGFDSALKAIEYQKNMAESFKAELEKYKSLGTPEELKKAAEQAKEGENLRRRVEAAKKGIEDYEALPDDQKYTSKTDEEIKKMFGLE